MKLITIAGPDDFSTSWLHKQHFSKMHFSEDASGISLPIDEGHR